MFDLSGKKALITGAAGGIGKAIAHTLHQQGAAVALSGRREEALKALADELGGKPSVLPCDLSDAEAAKALPARAEEALGGIDILINNAGHARDGLMMRMKDEDWHEVIKLDLDAVFFLTRAVLRPMMRQRWGRIITITSLVGVAGNPGQANYAAAKAGAAGMSRALAREIAGKGICVNCIAPGFIETPMTDDLNEAQKEAAMAQIPAGRFGRPDDVAAATLWLASEEAAYVTGQTIHVNGGMVMP